MGMAEHYEQNWSKHDPWVKKANAFIERRKGKITVDEMVEWDFRHGQHLFNWNDEECGVEWRRQQARLFLNSFRAVYNGTRVSFYLNVPGNEETGEPRQYYSLPALTESGRARAYAIERIGKAMGQLAAKLKVYKLKDAEWQAMVEELARRAGMTDESEKTDGRGYHQPAHAGVGAKTLGKKGQGRTGQRATRQDSAPLPC